MPDSSRLQQRSRATRRRRTVWWCVAGAVVLLLAVAGALTAFLVPKALRAADLLQSSIPLVAQIQASVAAGDTAAAQTGAADLTERTAEARAETSGRVWRALEWVPVAGANLRAVRLAAQTTDELAKDAVTPVAGLSLASLNPAGGKIDIAAVEGIVATVDGVAAAVASAQDRLAVIDRDPLVGQVASGVAQLDDAVAKASEAVAGAKPLVHALPEMLGADGARDVLVIFQNNGEVMPGGGTIGSLAQIHIDRGAIEIVAQKSAAYSDIPHRAEPVIPIAPDVYDLYRPLIGTHVQSLTRTPRFDLTFDIAQEFWRLTTGTTVDAVIGVDIVALTDLLAATGPVALGDDLVLTSENAVDLLLGDLYYTFQPLEVDAINQAFAAATIGKLFSGAIAVPALLNALGPSIEQGRIRVWSSRESEQSLIEGSPFDHRGPRTSAEGSELGIYFMDATPGKMQRFMTQSVTIENLSCAPNRLVRVTVDLANTVDPTIVNDLPTYVTGSARSVERGEIRVSALVYAQDGFTLEKTSVKGKSDPPRRAADGEYAVTQIRTTIRPGEMNRLVFEYSTETAEAIGADITPVVNPTELTAAPACS